MPKYGQKYDQSCTHGKMHELRYIQIRKFSNLKKKPALNRLNASRSWSSDIINYNFQEYFLFLRIAWKDKRDHFKFHSLSQDCNFMWVYFLPFCAAYLRVVFNWVSKVINELLWFAFLQSVIGSRFSRHLFNQSEVIYQNQSWLARAHFPALCVDYV